MFLVVLLVCPSVHFQHFAARGGFVGFVEVRQVSLSHPRFAASLTILCGFIWPTAPKKRKEAPACNFD